MVEKDKLPLRTANAEWHKTENMKRITLVAVLTLLSLATFARASAVLYSSDFSEDWNDWTIIDADGDGITWYTYDSCLWYGFSGSDEHTSADDWIVSPPVSLTAGTTYRIKAKHQSSHALTYALYASTDKSAAGLAAGTLVADLSDGAHSEEVLWFTPSESGSFYFGIHTDATNPHWGYIKLVSFEVKENVPIPASASDLKVCKAAGVRDAVLSWTLPPALDEDGIELPDGVTVSNVRVYRNGELAQTLPGDAVTCTDSGLDAGRYEYEVELDINGQLGNRSKVAFDLLVKDAPYVSYFQDPGWAIVNVDGGRGWKNCGYGSWGYSDIGYPSGMINDNLDSPDNWLISPSIKLAAGVEYKVKFWHYSRYMAEYFKLYAALGTSIDCLKSGTVVADIDGISHSGITQDVFTFTPAVSGEYNFGFHNYDISGPGYGSGLIITGFEVIPDDMPALGMVKDFTISPGTDDDLFALAATLSWNLPTVDTDGNLLPLPEDAPIYNVHIYRDDVLVKSLSGNATSWIDTADLGLTPGKHTYGIEVEVAGVYGPRLYAESPTICPTGDNYKNTPYTSDFSDPCWGKKETKWNECAFWKDDRPTYPPTFEDTPHGYTTGIRHYYPDSDIAWLHSPDFGLVGGKEYIFSFWHREKGKSFSKLTYRPDIYIYSSENSDEKNTDNTPNEENCVASYSTGSTATSEWEKLEFSFTPPISGFYWIKMWDFILAEYGYKDITCFDIREKDWVAPEPPPTPPVEENPPSPVYLPTYVTTADPLTANLAWELPSTYKDGSEFNPATGTIRIYRDGELAQTLPGTERHWQYTADAWIVHDHHAYEIEVEADGLCSSRVKPAYASSVLPYASDMNNAGWTVLNVNGGRCWDKITVDQDNPYGILTLPDYSRGVNFVSPYSAGGWGNPGGYEAADDWIVSPPLYLNGYKGYKVSFWHSDPFGMECEKFSLYASKELSPESLAGGKLIADISNSSTALPEWHRVSHMFIPEEDGYYYFGFHAHSAENERNSVQLTGFEVARFGMTESIPSRPTGLTAVPTVSETPEVKLSWEMPAKYMSGASIPDDALMEALVYRDGTLMYRGNAVEWTDNDVQHGEAYTYEVAVEVDEQTGPRAAVSPVEVLPPPPPEPPLPVIPDPAEDLTVTTDPVLPNVADISWRNPSTSSVPDSEPPITLAEIYRDGELIGSVTDGLAAGEYSSYEDNIVSDPGMYTYMVKVYNDELIADEGHPEVTRWVGRGADVPYEPENFYEWYPFNQAVGNDQGGWRIGFTDACAGGAEEDGDSWIISPPLYTQSGTKYLLEVLPFSRGFADPSDISVYLGSNVAPEEMTRRIGSIDCSMVKSFAEPVQFPLLAAAADDPSLADEPDEDGGRTSFATGNVTVGFRAEGEAEGRICCFRFIIDPETSVDEAVEDGSMRHVGDTVLFPDGATDITLVTVSGQVVRRCAAAGSIDLSQLAPGVYIVSCNAGGKRISLKVMK